MGKPDLLRAVLSIRFFLLPHFRLHVSGLFKFQVQIKHPKQDGHSRAEEEGEKLRENERDWSWRLIFRSIGIHASSQLWWHLRCSWSCCQFLRSFARGWFDAFHGKLLLLLLKYSSDAACHHNIEKMPCFDRLKNNKATT